MNKDALRIKENINMDEVLPQLGFEKSRDYFHCGDTSIRICDREIVHSVMVPGFNKSTLRRFGISKVILKLIEKDLVE